MKNFKFNIMVFLIIGSINFTYAQSNESLSKALAGMFLQSVNCEYIDMNIKNMNTNINRIIAKQQNGFGDDGICTELNQLIQFKDLVKQKMKESGCDNYQKYLNAYSALRENTSTVQVYCAGKNIKNKIMNFFSGNSNETYNTNDTHIESPSNTIVNTSDTKVNSGLVPSNKCSTYIVTAPQLNVRSIPSKPSRIVGRVNKNDRVCVYDFSGKWGKTDMGWISGKFLVLVNSDNGNILPSLKKGIVSGLDPNGDGFLAIRTKPNGTQIGRLYNGDNIQILNKRGKWYNIRKVSTGETGWSFGKWIKVLEETSMENGYVRMTSDGSRPMTNKEVLEEEKIKKESKKIYDVL